MTGLRGVTLALAAALPVPIQSGPGSPALGLARAPFLDALAVPGGVPPLAAPGPVAELRAPGAPEPLIRAPEASSSLGRLFDGVSVRAEAAPALLMLGPRDEGFELLGFARPYATRSQLRRIARRKPVTPQGTRFVVVGDAEPGRFWWLRRFFGRPGVFEEHLRRVRGRALDFVIQLGDMVSRGTPDRYAEFLLKLRKARLRVPYLTVLGNHDRSRPHRPSNASLYRMLFGSPDYLFDKGGVRFVVLDSSDGRLGRRRLEWLDRALEVPGRKIVFTHMPPRQLWAWTYGGLGGIRKGSRTFAGIVARRGVDRVYVGHVHGFGTADLQGVRYVLTGGGGSPLFPSGARERSYHHLRVEAGPDGVRETLVRLDGTEEPLP